MSGPIKLKPKQKKGRKRGFIWKFIRIRVHSMDTFWDKKRTEKNGKNETRIVMTTASDLNCIFSILSQFCLFAFRLWISIEVEKKKKREVSTYSICVMFASFALLSLF